MPDGISLGKASAKSAGSYFIRPSKVAAHCNTRVKFTVEECGGLDKALLAASSTLDRCEVKMISFVLLTHPHQQATLEDVGIMRKTRVRSQAILAYANHLLTSEAAVTRASLTAEQEASAKPKEDVAVVTVAVPDRPSQGDPTAWQLDGRDEVVTHMLKHVVDPVEVNRSRPADAKVCIPKTILDQFGLHTVRNNAKQLDTHGPLWAKDVDGKLLVECLFITEETEGCCSRWVFNEGPRLSRTLAENQCKIAEWIHSHVTRSTLWKSTDRDQ